MPGQDSTCQGKAYSHGNVIWCTARPSEPVLIDTLWIQASGRALVRSRAANTEEASASSAASNGATGGPTNPMDFEELSEILR